MAHRVEQGLLIYTPRERRELMGTHET